MRYYVDDISFDNLLMTITGWAAPEHQGDGIKVDLRTLDDHRYLPTEVEFLERPDVIKIMYGNERTEKYGFKLKYQLPSIDQDLELYMDAVEFDIDFARVRIRVKENWQLQKKKKKTR